MDTFDAIYQRRAVKHYDPNFEMPEEDIKKLFEAAIQSPTSFNIQNWRFVVLRDKEQKQRAREVSWDQAHVTDASIAILMCADLGSWSQDPKRYWRDAPTEVAEMLVGMIGPFYEGKERLQRDEAIRSCGIAAQTIMLAAKAMGYDSCPMIGFDPDGMAKVIDLPENHIIAMMVVVGKAIKPAFSKPGQLPLENVLIKERFGG